MSSSSTLIVNRSNNNKNSSSEKDISTHLKRLSRIIDSDSDNDLKSLPNVTNNNNEPIEKDDSEPEIVTVQTDCQIHPDEQCNLNKTQNVEDKSVFCNFDPIFNDDVVIDGTFTLADIEKELANIEIIMRKLNRKKDVLLSKKAVKLAQKKKIKKAVDSKNSIEFGFFDDCLTLTKKGTLKASKVTNKDTEIQILDISDEGDEKISNNGSKKFDLTKSRGNGIVKKGSKNDESDRTRSSSLRQSPEKMNKDEVMLISDDAKPSPAKSRGQLFLHKYDKHRIKRSMPSSDSDVEKDVPDEPKTLKRRRRAVNNKYSKKPSNRRTLKSSEIVGNDGETDESTGAKSTRFSTFNSKCVRKFPKFFKPKCFVKLFSHDLEKLKVGLITKTPKIDESLDDIDIEEVVLVETQFNIEAEENRSESTEDFDVLMVPDEGCDTFGTPIEHVVNESGCTEDYTVIDVNDVDTENLDILSILEKKNEVVTQFIDQ